MDESSSDDARAIPQYQPTPQRRSAAKPVGFYRVTTALPLGVSSRSNMIQRDKGKRKRVDSISKSDEDEQSGGNGTGGNGNDNGDGNSVTEGRPSMRPRPRAEAKERTPPYECEAREIKKDSDLRITETGPKMQENEAPRYYAKVVRNVERDEGPKSGTDKQLEESYRMPDHPPVLLPEIDLSLFHTPECTHNIPDREVIRFAMEPSVLPLLKRWAYMWLNPDEDSQQFHEDMQRTFPMDGDIGKPWKVGISVVAEHAAHRTGFTFLLAPLLYSMSRFAKQLVEANGFFFDMFSDYARATDERQKFAARLLLLVWDDLEASRDGLFGILLKGELARPNRPEVREVYEAWYIVDERLFQ